jgi:hypothetical protein
MIKVRDQSRQKKKKRERETETLYQNIQPKKGL